ncbi:RHS repeat-associated core domain-containing protein [Sorangium sp. So ce321]|uniref:RHS repeat domain-containing protein n=1 Tax=Sorangium sp. So ce321 TaxID=3133300 RepID=UPI003F607F41
MLHRFGMGRQLLYQESNDGGERWMLAGATGQRLRAWNGRGFVYRSSYDALRRPTHEHVQPASGSERLARRYVYGEAHPQATALNLRGRPYQVYDGAGVVTSLTHDFKGNLLQASRRLRSDVHADPDWSVLAALNDVAAIAAAAEPLLETESFATQTAYDALNRPTSVTAPDTSELRPTYNEAGLLDRVEARVRGAVTWTTFVDDIDYDAKGQRERIEYANGTSTAYTYDPLTFRLSRLRTTRSADSAVLQNLTYVYDPAGNIVEIGDSAQQTVFFNNAVVSPSAQYVYDAIYRLIEATGREHAGGLADVQRDQNDIPIQSLPHANDAQALRNYTEQYVYDAVGNLLRMVHQAGTGSWTRRYAYEATSNRLTSTSLPADPVSGPYSATYAHDEHGNMTAVPHIDELTWDEDDQLRSTDLGGGGVVHYTYDAIGQRVRKVWEHSGLVEERIYLGDYELYRRRNATGLVLERQTLHVMDGARRVAMVETKTVDTSGPFTVTPRVRYQLANHLESASLEVDGAGLVIGYEEYHPFGTTAYWSASSAAEVSRKRYRYTGKERDEETGLYYHGARYYAAWLGRWTAADPIGTRAGLNLFAYVKGNPVRFIDPTGTEDSPPPASKTPDIGDQISTALKLAFVLATDQTPEQFGQGIVDKANRAFVEPFATIYAPGGMLDKAAQKAVDLLQGAPDKEYVTPEEHKRMLGTIADVGISLFPGVGEIRIDIPGPRLATANAGSMASSAGTIVFDSSIVKAPAAAMSAANKGDGGSSKSPPKPESPAKPGTRAQAPSAEQPRPAAPKVKPAAAPAQGGFPPLQKRAGIFMFSDARKRILAAAPHERIAMFRQYAAQIMADAPGEMMFFERKVTNAEAMFVGSADEALVFTKDGTAFRGNLRTPDQFTLNANGSFTANFDKLTKWGTK